MQFLGSEYGVIVNDPELRGGFVAEAERSRRSARQKRRGGMQLRPRLANALRELATRIEPRTLGGSETTRTAFAD